MAARYANGRAAIMQDAACELGADALVIRVAGEAITWRYEDLMRTDDNNGAVSVRLKRDGGERLVLDNDETILLRGAAPRLFAPAARGVERLRVVGAVAASAWSIAALLLIGVPMAAEPIAAVLPDSWRAQLADISWAQIDAPARYCDDSDEANRVLNTLAGRMMTASPVPQRERISVMVIRDDSPNAFAMPDDTVVVTNSLIALAEQPDEIAGVISHEIAHIELNHVMIGYVRTMGAATFFDIVFGGGGLGQAVAVGASAQLSNLGYDRNDEAAADRRGFDYLEHANIDPGGLGRLFDRFARLHHEHPSVLGSLLSNHPASAERAAAARARARPGSAPSLTPAQWRIVRSACGGSASHPWSLCDAWCVCDRADVREGHHRQRYRHGRRGLLLQAHGYRHGGE